jgi:hypothetical protein
MKFSSHFVCFMLYHKISPWAPFCLILFNDIRIYGSNLLLFAADLKIYWVRKWVEDCRSLQMDINVAQKWYLKIYMELNIQKINFFYM